MTIPGPQIGGVSLLIHAFVIIAVKGLQLFKKLSFNLAKFVQKIFHPFLPNAK